MIKGTLVCLFESLNTDSDTQPIVGVVLILNVPASPVVSGLQVCGADGFGHVAG